MIVDNVKPSAVHVYLYYDPSKSHKLMARILLARIACAEYVNAALSYRCMVCVFVFPNLCVLCTRVRCAKTDEPIEMLF